MRNYDRVSNWLKVAGKEPSGETFSVQSGVMIEEMAEFFESVRFVDHLDGNIALQIAAEIFHKIGNELKKNGRQLGTMDRVACLDALCDIDVTLNGVAFLAGFDKNGADDAVLDSNDSKFEDGKAVILPGGKIGKGKNYVEPDLTPFV
jgi:hypothetical protein